MTLDITTALRVLEDRLGRCYIEVPPDMCRAAELLARQHRELRALPRQPSPVPQNIRDVLQMEAAI